MYVKDGKRFSIRECRHFQRLHVTSRPLAVVRRSGAAVEERTVEGGVARLRVLLRRNAQQRPPNPHFQPVERFVDRRVIRQIVLIKVEGITDLRHVLQSIRRFTVAVAVFEPITVQNDVDPAGEPAAGGLARVLSQRLFG
jgi:hypothetical protein